MGVRRVLNVASCSAPEVAEVRSERQPRRFNWERCNARTRGKAGQREPGRCKASGQGVGGRCHHHGGMALGAPMGCRRTERKRLRQLVLFTGSFELLPEKRSAVGPRSRWVLLAIPLDLYERLPRNAPRLHGDAAYLQATLERRGVPRKVATCWPQPLGYRIALKLAQRGRVAFVEVSGRSDSRRAARARVNRFDPKTRRLDPHEFLPALLTAGQRLLPRQRSGR